MTAVSAAWLEARLAEPARALGARIPPAAFELLATYASLVLDWGARINLTGAKTAEALADDHLADALALLAHLPDGPFSFVDVGSGAGLPGLVIAVLRADASGVVLEPIRKKHAFLAHAIRVLGLAGRVAARSERLDAHLLAGGQGAYDVAVSRAVWPAAEWLERGLPLLKAGGLWIGLTGAAAAPLPSGCVRHPYWIQGRERALLLRRA
jgi:16S rRNA (guanine527-N7)-methyltransferase